jgi:drug/metabolite transporter (DMT)-like permease
MRGSRKGRVALAFGAISLVWGSTYLAIAQAIETIPPLLMVGARSTIAGVLLLIGLRLTGREVGSARQWRAAALAGPLMFGGGQGLVAWAEQRIPSGSAAVLAALIPLMIALIESIRGERALGAQRIAALLLGFAGVLVMTAPLSGNGALDPVGVLVMLCSSLCWALGSVTTAGHKTEGNPLAIAGQQLVTGGVVLLAIGAMTEASSLELERVRAQSLAALAYLILFGSILSYGAYVWLLRNVRASLVATHAYINPVIALLLGAMLAGEQLSWRLAAATPLILVSIAVMARAGAREGDALAGGGGGRRASLPNIGRRLAPRET